MYADIRTRAMEQAIDETVRRRTIQQAYNERYHITPTTIQKAVSSVFADLYETQKTATRAVEEPVESFESLNDLDGTIGRLESEMKQAAKDLAFERAARLRDRIRELRKLGVLGG